MMAGRVRPKSDGRSPSCRQQTTNERIDRIIRETTQDQGDSRDATATFNNLLVECFQFRN